MNKKNKEIKKIVSIIVYSKFDNTSRTMSVSGSGMYLNITCINSL